MVVVPRIVTKLYRAQRCEKHINNFHQLILKCSFLTAWHARADPKCDKCDVVVKISSGPICGSVLTAERITPYYAFKGIPYAKPPTGVRRFAPLERCDPWIKTLLTVEEGPVCPQVTNDFNVVSVNPKGMLEDCMYANVYVPKSVKLNSIKNKVGLPILVNIHSGAFQSGSGNTDVHGPEYFMYKESVIVVTFNYRFGVLGFLSLNTPQIPGNNGLRDIIFFLEWLRDNACAFGGDPNNVTLMGQSMGSMSVHLLTLSTAAEGLFHRGIMMSGTAIPTFYTASPTFASFTANLFLEAAGITATDPDVIHQQLIEMSLDDIMYANTIVQYATAVTAFVPVVESEHPNVTRILDDEPLTLIAEGRGSNIPLIVGFTNNEAAFARRAIIYLNLLGRLAEDPRGILSPKLIFSLNATDATERAERVIDRYSNGTGVLTLEDLIRAISDLFFVYPTIKLAQFRSALGGAPLYAYEYSYESIFSIIKRAKWESYTGAAHLEDLTFLFRCTPILGDYVSFPPTNDDDHMKDWLTNFVLNFIHCDNPTCRDDAFSPWPPADYTLLELQSIAEPSVFNMEEPSDNYKDMVNFLDTIDLELGAISASLGIPPFP